MNPASTSDRGDASLARMRAVWRRRRVAALLGFGAPLAIVAGTTRGLPEVHRASATLLVERLPETASDAEASRDLELRLQTVGRAAMSEAHLRAVIDRFGLYQAAGRAGARTMRERVARLRDDVEVRRDEVEHAWGRATVAIAVGWRGAEPRAAARVADALAAAWIDEDRALHEREVGAVAEALRAQLDELRRTLDAQEARLREFRELHRGEMPELAEVHLATMQQLQARLQANVEVQQRAAERRRLRRAPAAVAPPAPDPAAPLRERLADLGARYTDAHPDLIRAREELARAERAARSSVLAAPAWVAEPEAVDVDADVDALVRDQRRLEGQIAAHRKRLFAAPLLAERMRALAPDHDATRQRYQSLLDRYEDARARLDPRRPRDRLVLHRAAVPTAPAWPDRARLGALGLVLSAALGFAVVALAERADGTFHDAAELRAFTRVPVLGAIPRIDGPAAVRRRRRLGALAALAVAAGLALVAVGAWTAAARVELIADLLGRSRA